MPLSGAAEAVSRCRVMAPMRMPSPAGRDAGEIADVAQADERARRDQAGIHHRHHRGAAGQGTRALIGREPRHRLGDAVRPIEADGGHAATPAARSTWARKAATKSALKASAFFFMTPSPNLPSRPVTETSER